VRAFILHDESGTIRGVLVPAQSNARLGVRAPQRFVAEVELPKQLAPQKLDDRISSLVGEFRVEPATTTSPARLLRMPARSRRPRKRRE
jgi:hypothetical protein